MRVLAPTLERTNDGFLNAPFGHLFDQIGPVRHSSPGSDCNPHLDFGGARNPDGQGFAAFAHGWAETKHNEGPTAHSFFGSPHPRGTYGQAEREDKNVQKYAPCVEVGFLGGHGCSVAMRRLGPKWPFFKRMLPGHPAKGPTPGRGVFAVGRHDRRHPQAGEMVCINAATLFTINSERFSRSRTSSACGP